MLDSREPKNGDFARYVEDLTKGPPPGDASKRPAKTPAPGSDPAAWGRDRAADRASREAAARDAGQRAAREAGQRAARTVEQALRKLKGGADAAHDATDASTGAQPFTADTVAKILTFVGIVVLLSSLLDDAPPFAHPFVGIVLLVAARALSVIARKRR